MNSNLLSEAQIEAVAHCVRQKIPFALCFEPGTNVGHFFATESTEMTDTRLFCTKESREAFAISLFAHSDECLVIKKDFDEISVLSLASSQNKNVQENAGHLQSVPYDIYSGYVGETILSLKKNGGKLVLARVITRCGGDPVKVAELYFNEFPQTFRYIYYTHQTGVWIGATPEILMEYDSETLRAESMSLAGTRAAGCADVWDKKNSEEHDFVTRHIKRVFEKYGENVYVSPRHSLRFGEIEHLCESISATDVTNPGAVIAELAPTPAVCGTVPDSAKVIAELEPFDRECYGGWLGIKRQNTLRTFVNLRCAKAIDTGEQYEYLIFAGGGITADSVVGQEWEESRKKSEPLLRCIDKTHL